MEKESICPLDCPDACSLRVEVEEGRVMTVDGDRRNPVTDDFICAKVRRMPEHLYGSDRLLHPAIREGARGSGEFRRASWDEALELVAGKLAETVHRHGGESILPFCYGGSNGLFTQDTADARLWARLGASRLQRTVCAAPTTAVARAMYGKMPGVAYEDYAGAELIVIWGVNPAVSGIHLMPHLQQAQRNGARLVVVDPRRNRLARQADLHLPVRPGTDVAVALALVNWLFENDRADHDFLDRHTTGVDELRKRAAHWSLARASEVAGVPPSDLDLLGRWYSEASPAVIRAGWGMERNRNGGSSVAAVLTLPAVAGKFGVPGGGYTLSNSGAFALDAHRAANAEQPATRTVNMNRLGRALTEDQPPVHALFVYNCNPVATMPDQERVIAGLEREDLFTVVFEQVMTDTCRYADVLLPATTFLEHSELRAGYGAMVLQRADRVIDPVGLARPNYEVFAELCERLGLSEPDDPLTPEEMQAAILGENGLGEALARDGIAYPEGGSRPVLFVDSFPRTPDRKARLFPEELDAEAPSGLYAWQPDPATAAYPLALISPATNRTISSTLGQLVEGEVPLEIAPSDAAERGIEDGVEVRVFNQLGEVRTVARVSAGVRPGVVYLPKGLWCKHTRNGRTSNALVPDALTDVAGGAVFNDARVQVERS